MNVLPSQARKAGLPRIGEASPKPVSLSPYGVFDFECFTFTMKLIKLRCCKAGSIILKLFLALICGFGAAYLFDLFSEPFGFSLWRENKTLFILQVFAVILFCSVVFWIGIILVYSCNSQLRMKTRVLGILFAWIPILNIVMLIIIIHTADKEYRFEKKKYDLDQSRREQKICSTKYPLLLVHGVFFRDFEHLNYWGRIPKELEENGASVYYGNHNSASPVAESAGQLKKRLFEIVGETGCGKVNIIAHSKGGLDARYLLSDPEAARHVASLTTINTPHRGCRFADYLFEKTSEKFKKTLADTYNAAAAKLGDTDPDFLDAVLDLTYKKCEERNKSLTDPTDVLCHSVGSIQRKATSGRFPLNLTNRFVRYFDGENDGLVGADSFEWGSKFEMLVPSGKRGISHSDMIDLNRENIKGFDVREFYVQLVSDLREAGC